MFNKLLRFEKPLQGKRILVTGHTGFKGSWLSLWLCELGAQVYGMSLAPETSPNLFDSLNLSAMMEHNLQDIRDQRPVQNLIQKIDPVVIFHLAAQPIVRKSYHQPLETFSSNIMGTANVLEAARMTKSTKAVVCVTTDKVYKNLNRDAAFSEEDTLGGKDPYSSSKAAVEIVAASYIQTLNKMGNGTALATARGGNVVGGGDWSEDRLIPDFVRAIESQQTLKIRSPLSTRPWQHVAAITHGYLALANALLQDKNQSQGAWNFGPQIDDAISVQALLGKIDKHWKSPEIKFDTGQTLLEEKFLALNSARANEVLGWKSAWTLEETLEKTASWYSGFYSSNASPFDLTLEQIIRYREAIA